jgi:hypothetical protein
LYEISSYDEDEFANENPDYGPNLLSAHTHIYKNLLVYVDVILYKTSTYFNYSRIFDKTFLNNLIRFKVKD